MEPSYIKWEFYGECSFDDESSSDFSNQEDDESLDDYDQVYSMLHDMYKSSNVDNDNEFHGASPSHEFEEPNEDAKGFYRLLKDAEQKLYPGCDKFTKLSCVV
ncbi:hypothetical protein PIB30_074537 [Stylosanthes scabra]|uniref:Uncharacterized protein n=1 Tax=Stylosanthes scabra TaxID=79078 RepID=A0ABU6WMX1_9FABA|nr:hypothetical protein [Stylosanthes scabra]